MGYIYILTMWLYLEFLWFADSDLDFGDISKTRSTEQSDLFLFSQSLRIFSINFSVVYTFCLVQINIINVIVVVGFWKKKKIINCNKIRTLDMIEKNGLYKCLVIIFSLLSFFYTKIYNIESKGKENCCLVWIGPCCIMAFQYNTVLRLIIYKEIHNLIA